MKCVVLSWQIMLLQMQGWEKDFAPIIKAIQDLIALKYNLDQINVVIRSGASEAPSF
jgi:hypothetical protein